MRFCKPDMDTRNSHSMQALYRKYIRGKIRTQKSSTVYLAKIKSANSFFLSGQRHIVDSNFISDAISSLENTIGTDS